MNPENGKSDMSARILVIEDDRTICDLMTYLLASKGYLVTSAARGSDGIVAAIDTVPDLIICDMFLPDMTGLDVLEQLRKSSFPSSNAIVAVTASNVSDPSNLSAVYNRITTAGFSGYISKPIRLETFVQQIEQFLPH